MDQAKTVVMATLTQFSNQPGVADGKYSLIFQDLPDNTSFLKAVTGEGNTDSWTELVAVMEEVEIQDFSEELEAEGTITFSCEVEGKDVGSVEFTILPLY